MTKDVQKSARQLKAAVVARMQDPATQQHQPGLLKAVQLCERFINSNAASPEAFAVLKEEVAKAMTAQQQVCVAQSCQARAGHMQPSAFIFRSAGIVSFAPAWRPGDYKACQAFSAACRQRHLWKQADGSSGSSSGSHSSSAKAADSR